MFVRVHDGEGRRHIWMAVTPLISHLGSVPPANVHHLGLNWLVLYERGLPSSRLVPLSLMVSVWTNRGRWVHHHLQV